MLDRQTRDQYLALMGIDVWVERDEPVAMAAVSAAAPAATPTPAPPPAARHPAPAPAARPDAGEIAALDWPALEARVAACVACGLHETRTQTVFGRGSREADWLIIGEAPGAEEDRQGQPFVGRAGQLLDAMIGALGLERDAVYIANILKCRPPKNRDPKPEEAACCEGYLRRQVALVRPKIILCVGKIAAQNLLKCSDTVGRMRGRRFEYEGIPVVVSYHPAYLLRSPQEKAKSWADLKFAMQLCAEQA